MGKTVKSNCRFHSYIEEEVFSFTITLTILFTSNTANISSGEDRN